MNNSPMVDLMIHDGLWEIFNNYHMGMTAENVAEKYGLSREQQDGLGLRSQTLAEKAIKEGRFKDEIVPVVIPQKKGDPKIFDTDEHPRLWNHEGFARQAKAGVQEGRDCHSR